MIALLELYKEALLAGILTATSLSILGCHLVSRDQSLQCLVVSQAATVGVLIGSVILIALHIKAINHPLPFIIGIVTSSACFEFGEQLARITASGKTSVLLSMFLGLLAFSYWLVSYFPALESHISQAFFGDIVTLTISDVAIISTVSMIALIFLVFKRKALANQSFIIQIIDKKHAAKSNILWLFSVISILLISSSIYTMGFLFIVSFMLLPTVILSYISTSSLKGHMILVAVLSSASMLSGFLLSLYFDRISTVPAIVLNTVAFGIALVLLLNRKATAAKKT